MLSEAWRVLSSDGVLVLKLPDFEEVLRRRRSGDSAYFNQWGLDKLVHMWDEDTIDRRASMIFCGYWNAAYGDEFSGERRPHAPGAYHGPARITAMVCAWLLDQPSPHDIARGFRIIASRGTEPLGTFNHRNAWSMDELAALLARHRFTILSTEDEHICRMPIPTIGEMRQISMYALAGKWA